jgi:predicted transcriptional regulator
MLTLEEIRKRLADRRLSVVARETGLTTRAIAMLRDGEVSDPKFSTIATLSAYFEAHG